MTTLIFFGLDVKVQRAAFLMIGTTSAGLIRSPSLPALLGAQLARIRLSSSPETFSAVAGWGRKRNVERAAAFASKHQLPLLRLEDGFLRSFGPGEAFPPLSLVVDCEGIYYDSTAPSALERMLGSTCDLLTGRRDEVRRARSMIVGHRLSKYNHAPLLVPDLLAPAVQRVLVVDQTVGDASVLLGGASAQTFADMLSAARAEHPHATIYVKTHPEVSSGRKRGYLSHVKDDERTVVIRQLVNPLSLIEKMDHVYAVTSQLGFEALLVDKPVSVFGMPWYAGWGVTDDRQYCSRRSRRRSVDELFSAAYFHYTRYLNPRTHERGTIFDVIEFLLHQRNGAERISVASKEGKIVGVGFRWWKAAHLRPFLSLSPERVAFVRSAKAARRLALGPRDCLVHWGRDTAADLERLAVDSGAQLIRMEDGFVRSVGLGSDFVRPLSLVLDRLGIYFDPTRPSDLEQLLNNFDFTADELIRARDVRGKIVAHGITKYNIEPRRAAVWKHDAAGEERRVVVLVPGQVEDDASIRWGCAGVNTNLSLLQAAREAHPDAFIVYKPHPDVKARNRAGSVETQAVRRWADHMELDLSIISCVEACDVVHTMTSLSGFDALMRGKRVVVHGRPFYAGWGLTEDRLPMSRRDRLLSLDQLVAGVLLHYPIYWDWELNGYTTCEAVLHRVVEARSLLEDKQKRSFLKQGRLARQWQKMRALMATCMPA